MIDHNKSSASLVSFGLFEAENPCDLDEVIAHMSRVASRIEKCSNGSINVALLKSFERPFVAVFAVSVTRPNNLPEAAEFSRGISLKYSIRIVEYGWFELSCRELRKNVPFARISFGDIVSVRRMFTGGGGPDRQEMLSYCCLAVLKSYFERLKGVYSYSFYSSLNGLQIMGIALWDSVESASVLAKNPESNPAIPFWKALGAKKLSYEIFQAVYVSHDSPLLSVYDNAGPGFRF